MSQAFDSYEALLVGWISTQSFTTPCPIVEDGCFKVLYSIGFSLIDYHSGEKNLSSKSIIVSPIISSPNRSS